MANHEQKTEVSTPTAASAAETASRPLHENANVTKKEPPTIWPPRDSN
jgi:hypothetical protein